jgi:SAM-dependent methyltransferase
MTLRDAWDVQAEEWTRFARDARGDRTNNEFNIPAFLELVPPAGRRTLDLGCGEGRVGAELARRGHAVVGIDSSPGMVAAARELIDAEVVDAAALPFRDGAFDLVVAFMSLMDMDDLFGAVRESARVLAAGGRMCFAVIHPLNFTGRFESKAPEAPFVIRSYFEPYRYDDVVERDGFRIHFAALHRPLETYCRALEDAGLLLETIREPPEPGKGDGRWARVPLFLHARAVKA